MKKLTRILSIALFFASTCFYISCDDLGDTQECTGCDQDAPWGTVDGSGCYATESECDQNESGNCVICE